MENLRNNADKKALILRLKRVEGQLRGIQQLIEDEADCEDIAHQFYAARRALDKSFHAMMACAFEHQFDEKMVADPKIRKGVEKMSSILARYS